MVFIISDDSTRCLVSVALMKRYGISDKSAMSLRNLFADSLPDDMVVENETTSHSLTQLHGCVDSVVLPPFVPLQQTFWYDYNSHNFPGDI